MIIDCHAHYTTSPPGQQQFREAQLASVRDGSEPPRFDPTSVSDQEIIETIESAQLRVQHERGVDLTIFSPRAGGMGHHVGDLRISRDWAAVCNDLVARVCAAFPADFVGACMLPQSPGAPPQSSVDELERCITELGFVGCNVNPNPSGRWDGPSITDRSWYPLYEKLVELGVPATMHVSKSVQPSVHSTAAYYIGSDTTVFTQLIEGDLFRDFPELKIIIPHGGGAVPFHWGRYRGIALELGRPPIEEALLDNVFFDTCVYGQAGMELLTQVVPVDNILFASELFGAIKGEDPLTGRNFDDTKTILENVPGLDQTQLDAIFEGNARKIYTRL